MKVDLKKTIENIPTDVSGKWVSIFDMDKITESIIQQYKQKIVSENKEKFTSIDISGEISDGITLKNLMAHKFALENFLQNKEKLHQDDVLLYEKLIDCMSILINDYFLGST